ncbi:MAG: tetratricopeptide repeat protein [Longimicrobiales bacterium]|nr:tetratricopeptide repeat protein [Longimicrobiales bacterium]
MPRLVRLLTRPLWREDPGARRSRRIRQAFATPVMGLVGAIWGALASPAASEIVGWIVGGALGFATLAYVYLRIEPLVGHLGTELFGRHGWIVGLVWDWVVVGGLAYLLTQGLGMPMFNAVTSGVVMGGAYAVAMAWFFDDGGSKALFGFISGGGGRPRVPFSHIETMLARGQHDEALEALEEFVSRHPRDPRGWITLGRLLDRDFDDPDRAFGVFKEGLELARLSVAQRQRYLHEAVRVCESCDALHRVVPLLEELAREHPDTLQGEWAEGQLRRIEDGSG